MEDSALKFSYQKHGVVVRRLRRELLNDWCIVPIVKYGGMPTETQINRENFMFRLGNNAK